MYLGLPHLNFLKRRAHYRALINSDAYFKHGNDLLAQLCVILSDFALPSCSVVVLSLVLKAKAKYPIIIII